ncbi:MAG: hypothetical protein HY769_07695 [Candidatus Stahlbacteria bacterium]|nr:hypothetical protein [Candidatus Stahlbacteria bacterium]
MAYIDKIAVIHSGCIFSDSTKGGRELSAYLTRFLDPKETLVSESLISEIYAIAKPEVYDLLLRNINQNRSQSIKFELEFVEEIGIQESDNNMRTLKLFKVRVRIGNLVPSVSNLVSSSLIYALFGDYPYPIQESDKGYLISRQSFLVKNKEESCQISFEDKDTYDTKVDNLRDLPIYNVTYPNGRGSIYSTEDDPFIQICEAAEGNKVYILRNGKKIQLIRSRFTSISNLRQEDYYAINRTRTFLQKLIINN